MNRFGRDNWESRRRKMLEETERFIEWGLKHPHLVNWIPSKPVGSGGFPSQVADWFYQAVFWTRSGHNARWRRLLRLGRR